MKGVGNVNLTNVVDRKSFQEGYGLLSILERMTEEHDLEDSFQDQELIERYIVDLKRELRKYSHNNPNERMAIWAGIVESRLAWSYGIDGYVELITFPDGIASMETVESIFEDYIKINYYPTYYDCTGQAFTRWHKTFQRNGRYCIYHSVAFDV